MSDDKQQPETPSDHHYLPPLPMLEKIRLWSMAALHNILAMTGLGLVLASFLYWPSLKNAGPLLVGSVAFLGASSALFNSIAGWKHLKAVARQPGGRSKPDLVAFSITLVTLYMASKLFSEAM